MECREFRDLHLAFVDNALPEADLTDMQRHLFACERCARHDTAIRRGLLVLRNLPTIEPSPDFATRLNARLAEAHRSEAHAAMYRGPGVGSFMMATAGVVAVGFLAASMLSWVEPRRQELTLAPVVASRPELPPAPFVNPTFVASASSGMPMWPAAVFAEQAPLHFVNEEFQFASWDR